MLALQARRRQAPDAAGFTILEILVASAIMAVGLVMILGLFPFGIKVGREVVEDTTGISIARSVADAIRAGMRNHLRTNSDRDGTAYRYFIFRHKGVRDRVPSEIALESPRHDYYILLPRHRHERSFDGGSDSVRRDRAIDAASVYVYPESDKDLPNGGGDPFRADNDGDDWELDGGISTILVDKVYSLRAPDPGESREAYERWQKQHHGGVLRDDLIEQYSYAFSIRPSYFDTNLHENPNIFKPGNELYHVRVMVFRSFEENFVPASPGRRAMPVEPVFELDFEVSI